MFNFTRGYCCLRLLGSVRSLFVLLITGPVVVFKRYRYMLASSKRLKALRWPINLTTVTSIFYIDCCVELLNK